MTRNQANIAAINAKFDAAFNAKDASAIAPLYHKNAVIMPAPAGTPIEGREAIAAFFTGLMSAGVIDHKLTLLDAIVDENLAYQRGQWSGAMIDAEGVRQTFGGNVHFVYQLQAEGNWLAMTHIWN